MYYTPETLLNYAFEDLRKPKAPNILFLAQIGEPSTMNFINV
jgi:hypothetical protein